MKKHRNHLLVAQVAPVQPGAHVQVKELTPSLQVPPFWQGFGLQLLISRKKIIFNSSESTVLEQSQQLYLKIQSLDFSEYKQTYLIFKIYKREKLEPFLLGYTMHMVKNKVKN